jgi:ribosomal protein S25
MAQRRILLGAASLLELVDQLFCWPVITVNSAAERLKMSYQGAQYNVLKLEERGLLFEVTGNLRNKRYLARPITELMS